MVYEKYLELSGGVDTQFKYAKYLQDIEGMSKADSHRAAMEKYRNRKEHNSILDVKWNEYRTTHDLTLYLYDGEDVFRIAEGTGDNLTPDELEYGYKDYWVTQSTRDDGGMWLEAMLIVDRDYTVGEVIDRLKECDLWESSWRVIENNEVGRALFDERWEGL